MRNDRFHDPAGVPPDFMDASMRALAQGATFSEFAAILAREIPPDPVASPEAHRARATAFAREIWRVAPDPTRGWRPRPFSKPGRNDPCDCGSGRKYKKCCEPHATAVPPSELPPQDVAGMLFLGGPPAWREPQALRRMPARMLGQSAFMWGEEHGQRALADLLEPVFLDPAGLSDDHEPVFDLLLDATLECGLEERRDRVCRAVAGKATSRALRCTARARLASMASDRQEHAVAWEHFKAAQREAPDDPQLLHLELTLLLSEGRADEAKLRATVLAAKARRQGYGELADILERLTTEGLDVARELGDDDEEAVGWAALLREARRHLDASRFRQSHTFDAVGGELVVGLPQKTRRLVKPWSSRFAVVPPMLTLLDADADELLDEPDAACEWLRGHPQACCALPVLDDLLIAARRMAQESASPDVIEAGCELAVAAAAMVVEALDEWPDARIPWGVTGNRPLLRVVSQGISAALQVGDDAGAIAGMRWMLRRNPTDNHGWREALRERLLDGGDAAGALELMDAYPDDLPPASHDRALALFMAGRREEAGAILSEAHPAFPAYVDALLPERLDRPAGPVDGFYSPGSADHAWLWRQGVRKAWVRSGALDWLRDLELPEQAPVVKARSRKPAAVKKKALPTKKGLAAPGAAAPSPKALAQLRKFHGDRLPWLLGWLACFAWAPGMTMPSAWIDGALAPVPDDKVDGNLQRSLEAVMEQYNFFNGQRLAGGEAVPLPETIAADDDAGWIDFAAGFVQGAETQGRGAWQGVGAVNPRSAAFKPLYQLAARAAPGPDGWRASTEASAPLLAVVGETEPVRKLLEQALLPLWRAAVAAR